MVGRSKWKPVISFSSVEKGIGKGSVSVRSRAQIIMPCHVNSTLLVENGLSVKSIKITSDHVGHRLGEFFPSKKRVIFKNNKK